MLKPWLIAWFIYSIYNSKGNFNIESIYKQIYSPYYHLWFIPSLFISILLITLFYRVIKDTCTTNALLLCLGLFLFNVNNSHYGIDGFYSCHMLIYIIIGIVGKKLSNKFPSYTCIIVIFLFLGMTIIANASLMPIHIYRSYFQLPLCTVLCLWGIQPIIERQNIHLPFIELWGKYSLEIYLWHVIPIIILKHFFMRNEILYYIISLVLLIIFSTTSFYMVKHHKKMAQI